MSYNLGYTYRWDGNYLIRKTCSSCGEQYDVHAMQNSRPVELCRACEFVADCENNIGGQP